MSIDLDDVEIELVLEALDDLLSVKLGAMTTLNAEPALHKFSEHDFGIPKIKALKQKLETAAE
jgi:hypothetical protein